MLLPILPEDFFSTIIRLMISDREIQEAQRVLYRATHESEFLDEGSNHLRIEGSNLLIACQNLWNTRGLPVELNSIPYMDNGIEGEQFGGPYVIQVTPKVELADMSGRKNQVWLEERLRGSSGDNFSSIPDGGVLKVQAEDEKELDLLRLFPMRLPLWLNRKASLLDLAAGKTLVTFLEKSLR